MTEKSSPFDRAFEELRAIGIALRSLPGEYRVNYLNGREATVYRTDDLADALAKGRVMAECPPPPALPPLGPTGRRITRRGQMLKHNAKIAARRRRQARTEGDK